MKKPQLDTIYNYTKALLTERGESLTRTDTKISIYIGFSTVLIRLALDLSHESIIQALFKAIVCIFASLTIILSSLALLGKPSGKVANPDILMSKEWYVNKTEEEYKCYIINGFRSSIEDLDLILAKRQVTQAWITTFFLVATIFFAIAVYFSARLEVC